MKKTLILIFIIVILFIDTSGVYCLNTYIQKSLKCMDLNSSEYNVVMSPLIETNVPVTYSVNVYVENISRVLTAVAYFDKNKSLMLVRNVTIIDVSPSEHIHIKTTATPIRNMYFSAILIIANGSGLVQVSDIKINKHHDFLNNYERVSREVMYSTKSIQVYESMNIQKIINEDDQIKIEIALNKTYHPGDTIRVDFYITNKQNKAIQKIDIKLEVYYIGFKIFSYSHPSWREYYPGQTVHIFYVSELPIITAPGSYTLKFYITPQREQTRELSIEIIVKPTNKWIVMFVFSIVTAILGLSMVIKLLRKNSETLRNAYRNMPISQKSIFLGALCILVISTPVALGIERYTDTLAGGAYFLLLFGIIYELIDTVRSQRNCRYFYRIINKKTKPLAEIYKASTVGQKIIILGIISMILSQILLSFKVEEFTTYIARYIYYVLFIGVLNEVLNRKLADIRINLNSERSIIIFDMYILLLLSYLTNPEDIIPIFTIVIISVVVLLKSWITKTKPVILNEK